jgi:hypothetical protein
MIVTEKSSDGKVISYAEYNICDKFGHPCEGGQYAYIFNVWLHESYRPKIFKKIFTKWIREELPKYPYVRWIYWTRQKYGGKASIYNVRRLYGR